ncbi:MAG: ABC transporter ATP-binding protein [Natronohydrobacter sp.]|nr:ABC transporter ATP-binding protein [Natronohydrobacter sp.]
MFDITSLKKAWDLLDPRERRNALKVLAIAMLSAFASTAMVGAVMPFLSVLSDPSRIQDTPALAWAYARFGFTSSYSFLVALGLGALAVIVVAMAIQVLKVYAVARFAMMRVHSLSFRLMARYLGQPYEYFLDHHSGEMGTRVLAEAQEVVNRFLKPMTELITSSLTVVALVGFLLWVQPAVAFTAFALVGGVYGGTYALTRMKLRRLGQQRVAANSERFRLATEALGGVKDIKLLGRERAYVDRFRDPSHRMADVQTRAQVLSQIPKYVIQGIVFGGVVVLCLVLLDPATFGDGTALATILPILGVFAFAGQRMMPELGKVYESAAKIQSGKAAVETVHADLVGASAILPRQMPQAIGLTRALQLDHVSYRYPKADLAGVSDIALTIRAGEKIGIVGGTGAGKTTLADIILGLLRPQAGGLVVDGTPVTDDTLRAWQQTVGYVPQEIFLTDASVAENIALGIAPEDIDQGRLMRAARIASIDTFIRTELPDGYDTTVGERGVRLSGGQRQRIGIARALYHDADLIVFDEATSALDNLTEAEVMAAIDALPGDKTVVMIAHRLSTVKRCDRIVVMEKGRMVGCDGWDALMDANAAFQRIARLAEAV